VRWPGVIQANTMTSQVGHLIDFMATFMELGHTKYPKTFQGNSIILPEGKSLVPIFHGRQQEAHDQLCWE